jgi:hypothetical protein
MALLSTQTRISGGSSDTEQKALAVMPRTSLPWRQVTTVTPLAQVERVPRNRSGSTATAQLLALAGPTARRLGPVGFKPYGV